MFDLLNEVMPGLETKRKKLKSSAKNSFTGHSPLAGRELSHNNQAENKQKAKLQFFKNTDEKSVGF